MSLDESCKYCGGELHWVFLPLSGSDSEKPEYGVFQQCGQCGMYRRGEVLEKLLETREPRDRRRLPTLDDIRRLYAGE